MRKITKLCFLALCVIYLVKYTQSAVSLRQPSPAALGTNVVLYCDINNEVNVPGGIFWGRQSYDGSNLVSYITASLLPNNYATAYSQVNSTYYVATLTITGVTTSDYATFICMSKSSKNLTQTTASVDPLTLCKNGSYNHVVYSFLLATNIVLVALMIFILRCHMQFSTANIGVAFGCILGAILFTILMVIFWISPIFAAPYDSSSYIYWSPIVIVPASVVATFILWGGLFFFLIKSLLANKKEKKNIISLVVFACVALVQLILILVIIFSIVYCTGQSVLPSSTDYSAASVTCSVLTFAAIIALCAYVFWMFKDNFKTIGILNRPDTKYSAREPTVDNKKKQDPKKVETKVETITDRPDTGRSTVSVFNASTVNTDDEGEPKKGGKKGKKPKDAEASGAESATEGGKKKKGKKADAGGDDAEGGEKKKKGKKKAKE